MNPLANALICVKCEQKRIDSLYFYRRGDIQPNNDSQVCSCHFRDGNFENLPTLFKRNGFNDIKFSSPEKFTRKARKRQLFSALSVDHVDLKISKLSTGNAEGINC